MTLSSLSLICTALALFAITPICKLESQKHDTARETLLRRQRDAGRLPWCRGPQKEPWNPLIELESPIIHIGSRKIYTATLCKLYTLCQEGIELGVRLHITLNRSTMLLVPNGLACYDFLVIGSANYAVYDKP